MVDRSAKSKFDIGECAAIAADAKREGVVRISTIYQILFAVDESLKMTVYYVLRVDGPQHPLFKSPYYLEDELLTTEEAKKVAATSLRERADRIEKASTSGSFCPALPKKE